MFDGSRRDVAVRGARVRRGQSPASPVASCSPSPRRPRTRSSSFRRASRSSSRRTRASSPAPTSSTAGDENLTVALSLKVTPIAEPATHPRGDVVHQRVDHASAASCVAHDPRVRCRRRVPCARRPRHRLLVLLRARALPRARHQHHRRGAESDGTAATIHETTNRIGDALGGAIDPAFDMTGYSKIRFSCNFDNPRDETVRYGVGTQEMCTFLAFTDSAWTWGGGALDRNETPTIVDTGRSSSTRTPAT